ncbi:hypothetical protein Vadar_010296 [Vaccinium darrowii]|uniref:Uncharacterized protein n=1 Tax=Vaccinium darrowii TaxID=229202 RepID=A0ACB7XH15_9ERIC|nr:hypothetical protein Vadar_010296 [Vaccinium darrowii]
MATNAIESIKIEDDVVEVEGVGDKSVWSKKNEAIFIKVMEEEVISLGSRETGTFQKESWPRMRKALTARTSYPYTKLQFRNKFNLLRTLHTKFVSLCSQTGVGWDAERNTITTDDDLWQKLFKVNNKAKHFKKKGFPHYAAMTRILGDTTATGFNVHPSTQSRSGTDSSDPSFDIKEEEDNDDLEVQEVQEVSGKGKQEVSGKGKQERVTRGRWISLKQGHNAKSSSVTVTSQDHSDVDDLLMDKCMAVLNEMEDLDGPSYAKGLKLLKEDPSWRKLFVNNMSEKRRKDLVASLQMESSDDSDKELESDSDDNTIIALVTVAIAEHHRRYADKIPCRTSILRGHDYVIEVLNGHDARCEESFRMETHVFIALCEALKIHAGLKHSRLGKVIIQPPSLDEVPSEITHNPKYWPFFKDRIGAIDGTHIDAKVPAREQIPYRGRHKTTSQNVMAACSFDMRFTYVLSGWEGTANDSRVLLECANNPTMQFPMPPQGKTCLYVH